MMRSMFSGVAGLKTHPMKMDVIGNNIPTSTRQLINPAPLISANCYIRRSLLHPAPTAQRAGPV